MLPSLLRPIAILLLLSLLQLAPSSAATPVAAPSPTRTSRPGETARNAATIVPRIQCSGQASLEPVVGGDCVAALARLPDAEQGIDYHWLPDGICVDTALTTLGHPLSPYHLPRSVAVGGCRIRVALAHGATAVYLTWGDVKLAASMLLEDCVLRTPHASGGVAEQLGGKVVIVVEGTGPGLESDSGSDTE